MMIYLDLPPLQPADPSILPFPLLCVSPPSQRPRPLRPLGPPSLAAWLQLTCGMAHSKHLMELLLRPQKAISPNHCLLMPLTPGFHTHIYTGRSYPHVGKTHKTYTFCLSNTFKHLTKPLLHETTKELGIHSNSCRNTNKPYAKPCKFQTNYTYHEQICCIYFPITQSHLSQTVKPTDGLFSQNLTW